MNDARHFLVVSHTGRQNALEATGQVCTQLLAAGAGGKPVTERPAKG